MTKITTYNRGIIIDGHADTKEECETITLLCNSLAKDENFKQVAYDKGYAEFERIGKAEELKFAPEEISITVNGTSVGVWRQPGDSSSWQDNLKGNNIGIYSISGNTVIWSDNTILQYNGADVLPTDNIIQNGAYTTRAASTTGETWVLNETISYDTDMTANIRFVSNNTPYTVFVWNSSANFLYYHGSYGDDGCYEQGVWQNNAYKTVSFVTAPTGTLLTWLQANGVKQANASLEAGTYKWKDTPNVSGYTFIENLDFICNIPDFDDPNYINITVSGEVGSARIRYNETTTVWSSAGWGAYYENAQIITLTTNQEVSQAFYDWAITGGNLVKQSKLSVDLTTLNGWSNLSSGSHTIKLVAKGSGYRDSEKSEGVSVTKAAEVYTDCLTFTGESSEFTLAVGTAGAKEWDGTVYYSTDHNTWNVWDGTAISSANKKLYLRGKNNTTFYTSKGARLSLSAKAGCSGNIQTLLDYENPPTSISVNRCYEYMFGGCTNLISAPELSATTLTSYCYAYMFYDANLTAAPELPATTLAIACYNGIFSGCTSLISPPELPATTLAIACYGSMFYKCTSLTSAPVLPATTLTDSCYNEMFYGCTSLTTAPNLPATIVTSNCYAHMFHGCTSLTTAPNLPATALEEYCYQRMFDGCSKLKVNVSSGNKIFTCPSSIPNRAIDNMFTSTGGSFKGTPTAGNTYYWTE